MNLYLVEFKIKACWLTFPKNRKWWQTIYKGSRLVSTADESNARTKLESNWKREFNPCCDRDIKVELIFHEVIRI